MGNTISNGGSSTLGRSQKSENKTKVGAESSRILFLLYLIHRTWNIVVDSVDSKGKRSHEVFEDSGTQCEYFDEHFNPDLHSSSDEDQTTLYGSQYSFCSCSYCYESNQNGFYSSAGLRMSICESELSSFCVGYQMAPSTCQTFTNSQSRAPKMSSDSSTSFCVQNFSSKENQRPPVYNPEDYAQSLKKFGRKQTNNGKSIYDTNSPQNENNFRSSTLPAKGSDYKNNISPMAETDCEMTLRQFGSITDLLTKLRADLRASFPSFVQEFVSQPLDGTSLLLETLRAIQLSLTLSGNIGQNVPASASMPRNSQSYQRRALLDELACLQCLSVCCCRSPEASIRLGTSSVGLLPLAAAATGQGIRSRILALQLLTSACEKSSFNHGSQKLTSIGHTAVSEALSTLRLRCGEPVRFRLLIGMLNSGGGSGELQAVGLKFLNAFLESADNMQTRLYLQAELFQAGFDPGNMTKTISSTSPWLEKLRAEIKYFEDTKIDIEKLQFQARESERVRNQMVILERKVQILQEEKTVLTSMEKRLQERCAELQREVFRLQGISSHRNNLQSNHNNNNNNSNNSDDYKNSEKRPVALPRHVPPSISVHKHQQNSSSEHEDEGISSSETGQSLSPVPILVIPENESQNHFNKVHRNDNIEILDDKDNDATIEEVIEELKNIVNDVEKDISTEKSFSQSGLKYENSFNNVIKDVEQDIVPVNLLPQPPRKSKSLAYLMSQGDAESDLDASEYGLLLIHNAAGNDNNDGNNLLNSDSRLRYFDEIDFETEKPYTQDEVITSSLNNPHHHHHYQHNNNNDNRGSNNFHPSTNREILDAIMKARETKNDPTIDAFRFRSNCSTIIDQSTNTVSIPLPPPPPQHFNGVFFMTEMNTPQKYPKFDITTALQTKCIAKNLDCLKTNYGLDSLIDIVLTSSNNEGRSADMKNKQILFGSAPILAKPVSGNGTKSATDSLFTNNIVISENITSMRTKSNTNGAKVTDIPSGLY